MDEQSRARKQAVFLPTLPDGRGSEIDTTCDAPDDDGLRNECDDWPADSNKIEPGTCGCGVDDTADPVNDGVLLLAGGDGPESVSRWRQSPDCPFETGK